MSISSCATESAPPAAPRPAKLRLEYLDGLRGLAASFVVLHHAYLECRSGLAPNAIPHLVSRALEFLDYGHYAVTVFIVLSGYCLMLPVAQSTDRALRGGFRGYIARRARRILPPYYAALAICLLLIACVPELNRNHVPPRHWDMVHPAFSAGNLLSHLLVLHNVKLAWMYRIDHPMWSVATEWQIYFVFGLVLLPIWRRLGDIATLAAAAAIGILPHFLVGHAFEEACPWFLTLFAFGMAAASVGFTRSRRLEAARRLIPWDICSAVLFSLWLAVAIFDRPILLDWDWIWVLDLILGAAVTCLVVGCTAHLTDRSDEPAPLTLRLIGARPAVAVGIFSYSLYLMHAPVIALLNDLLVALGLGGRTLLAAMLTLGLPVSLALTYAFHLVFERRFMPGQSQSARAAGQKGRRYRDLPAKGASG